MSNKRKEKKRKIYEVTYYKKHYLHQKFLAESKKEAIGFWGLSCPPGSYLEKVEEL
jgi:hypothetical protein